MKLRTGLVALAAATALVVTGCSPSNEKDSDGSAPESTAQTTSAAASHTTAKSTDEAEESGLTFKNAVVREKSEGKDMTAIFGTLVNNSDESVTITGFTSSIKAKSYQMHETVNGHMQEMTEPLTLAAGEERELAPGGDHFMLMGIDGDVPAGSTVTLTLDLSNGKKVEFNDVPVRTMGAGDEDYGADGELQGHTVG